MARHRPITTRSTSHAGSSLFSSYTRASQSGGTKFKRDKVPMDQVEEDLKGLGLKIKHFYQSERSPERRSEA